MILKIRFKYLIINFSDHIKIINYLMILKLLDIDLKVLFKIKKLKYLYFDFLNFKYFKSIKISNKKI